MATAGEEEVAGEVVAVANPCAASASTGRSSTLRRRDTMRFRPLGTETLRGEMDLEWAGLTGATGQGRDGLRRARLRRELARNEGAKR